MKNPPPNGEIKGGFHGQKEKTRFTKHTYFAFIFFLVSFDVYVVVISDVRKRDIFEIPLVCYQYVIFWFDIRFWILLKLCNMYRNTCCVLV